MDMDSDVADDQGREMGRAHHVINIGEAYGDILNPMVQEIERLRKTARKSSCCIFRVPQSLVQINEKAYQPHIVSIGPYHHGKGHLGMIEQHKWQYLGDFVARTQQKGVRLDKFYEAIASKENKIRDCYSEVIKVNSNDLVRMMVLDGIFIIELFCKVGKLVHIDKDDPIFNMEWVLPFLSRDLIVLENQIPFFVLQTVFELSASSRENTSTLAELTLEFFNHAAHRPDEVIKRHNNLQGQHLLDLFRLSFIPSPETPRKNSSPVQLIQSAKKLRQVGIKFKVRKADSFLDVKFSDGVLEIPRVTIDDFTRAVFLNFVAFEQCHKHCSKHITNYVTFMGCLINTPSDAEFLCDRKIIENYFGTDKEVARLFANISKDVVFDLRKSYLSKLFEDVNGHCGKCWSVWWADLKHTYFDSPWSFISAVAAVLFLFCNAVQAFFAVYGYVHPPKSHKG